MLISSVWSQDNAYIFQNKVFLYMLSTYQFCQLKCMNKKYLREGKMVIAREKCKLH